MKMEASTSSGKGLRKKEKKRGVIVVSFCGLLYRKKKLTETYYAKRSR